MKTYSLGLYEKAMPSSLTWREKLQTAKYYEWDRYADSHDVFKWSQEISTWQH